MLGKVCILRNDTKKEKYIVFNSLYQNEVLDIIGIGKENRGKTFHLRGEEIQLDEESQKKIEEL